MIESIQENIARKGRLEKQSNGDFEKKQASFFRRLPFIYLAPIFVFALSFFFTYQIYNDAKTNAINELQIKFDFRVRELSSLIKQRLLANEQVLWGAAGLFDASEEVNRKEFFTYIRTLHLEENYPGIQGVGFSKVLYPKELKKHIRAIRSEGFLTYIVKPEGDRELYTSIIYLEPFDIRNQRAFGYDMYSEPVRQKAMALARDQAKAVISGKVELLQEFDKDIQAGFLMYIPVYKHGTATESIEDRRLNIIGWAYSPLRMGDLMRSILGNRFSEFSIKIFDGESVSEEALMYDSLKDTDAADTASTFKKRVRIETTGHVWTMVTESQPIFRQDSSELKLILFMGIGISLLLAMITWFLAYGRSQAMKLAKKMNAELIKSEMKFRTMSDYTYNWEYWLGPDNKVIYTSPSCELVTGYTQDEFMKDALLIYRIIDPRDISTMDEHLQNDLFHDSTNIDFRIKRRDGEIRWIEHGCLAVYGEDGEFLGRRVSNRDITERKNIEAKLSELNRDFVYFLENTSDFVYFKDKDSRFRFCSQTLADITGHKSWRDMIGKHDLEVFPEDTAKIYYEEELPVFEKGTPIINKVDPYYDQEGIKKWVSTSKWPILSAETDSVIGIFGISRDITDLKNAEKSIMDLNTTLEERVEREIALRLEQERMLTVQARHAAMGEMISNIAHQWKQPLNSLSLIIQDMQDAFIYGELNKTYVDEVVKTSMGIIAQMATTVDDFRSFFKPSKEEKEFSISDVIKNSLVLLSAELKNKGIVIETTIKEDIRLKGHPNELSQVLLNLIGNAKDALIERSVAEGKIKISLFSDKKDAFISVLDNAGGIDKDSAKKIFNPYFTTREKGTGIGLYMSKTIVEQHMGGAISFANKGEGVEFKIALPLKK